MAKYLLRAILLVAVIFVSLGSSNAFVVQQHNRPQRLKQVLVIASTKKSSSSILDKEIQANLNVLYRAADTKQEDSDAVFEALSSLEKQMRQAAKSDPEVASETFRQLTGSWRLIFTTGTAKTQERNNGRRINYFPLKAIQSFDTTEDPARIKNAIYLGDFCALQFSGTCDFDMLKRRLNFDFDAITLFNGAWTIPLKRGQAASLGSKSGLGSDSNVANAEKKERPAFFNWISADENIATARGGGGGLALWKRIE